MPNVTYSTVINAPIEAVWALLRDFNGYDRWRHDVASSDIERGNPADKVGCIRRFGLADGAEIKEQLLTLSDIEQSLTYCLLDTPIPLFNCVTHLRLSPVTDDDSTFCAWETAFDAPAGRGGELSDYVRNEICEPSFQAVRQHLEDAIQ